MTDGMPGWDQAEAQRRFGGAVDIWHTARLGLDLIRADSDNLIHGLRIVAAFGRSSTFALERLRGIAGLPFDEWYEPERAAMSEDLVMRQFVKVRNASLHQGELPGVTVNIKWSNLVLTTDDPEFDPFAAVPMDVTAWVDGGPTEHQGQELESPTVEQLCFLYLDYLLNLLRRAAAQFDLLMPA